MEGTLMCRKCGKVYPATAEYFVKHKNCKLGLQRLCRKCHGEAKRYYRTEHLEAARASARQSSQRYRAEHPEAARMASQRYRDRHPEVVRASARQSSQRYRAEHPEAARTAIQCYRDRHPEAVRTAIQRYRDRHPEVVQVIAQRRRARKREMADTFTAQEWNAAISYFEGRCTYCGQEARLTQDHYIPISHPDCPGTVRENILPACKSCNSSKGDKLPEEWLKRQFGEETARVIMSRIERYFNAGKVVV